MCIKTGMPKGISILSRSTAVSRERDQPQRLLPDEKTGIDPESRNDSTVAAGAPRTQLRSGTVLNRAVSRYTPPMTKSCFSSFQPGGGSVIKLLMQATGARLRRVFVKLHLYQTSLALLSRRPVVVPAIPKSKEIPL